MMLTAFTSGRRRQRRHAWAEASKQVILEREAAVDRAENALIFVAAPQSALQWLRHAGECVEVWQLAAMALDGSPSRAPVLGRVDASADQPLGRNDWQALDTVDQHCHIAERLSISIAVPLTDGHVVQLRNAVRAARRAPVAD